MPLEITIIRSPRQIQTTKLSQTFSGQGGTLGRGPDNAWVLEDPERFISARHSQISFENGQYYLSDLSTNGTYYNGASEPIGHGNRVSLKEGDRFSLGDYEFQVSLRAENGQHEDPFAASFAGNSPVPGTDAGNMDAGMFATDPFANPMSESLPPLGSLIAPGYEETDPLVALDKAGKPSQANPFLEPFTPSQPDNADPMQHAVSWPNAIPEDWDDELTPDAVSAPARSSASSIHDTNLLSLLEAAEQQRDALEEENRKLLTEVMQLKQRLKDTERSMQAKPAQNPKVHQFTQTDAALIDAIGLSRWNLSDKKKLEISVTIGELVRETLLGLMQALSFRKKIKEEFRINVTTIQPVENNPLKFSANLDDAIENMFIRDNKAYMKPLDAVREGFQGISEHQVAVLAGIQAAFRGMMERFDPETLEKRFEKFRKAGVIKVGQKSKNWDSYKEFHHDLVNNLDNSFQHLFGYDFMQAYEAQLQRLAMSRRTRAKAKS